MSMEETTPADENKPRHFIEEIVEADLREGRVDKPIVTRFPPEPNGYLHIGHAKSICLNFGLAAKYSGRTNLRFDDTNPTKEEQRYIDAIKEDVRWLGFDWGENETYASDCFDQLYEWACLLIKNGKAYVDDQTPEQIRENRGSLSSAGTNSPFRDRSPEESLDLFERMKAGEFENGQKVLRAKIDMATPNMNLRDPVMYRILHQAHPRTGDKWKIYPMYDWAHGQCDWIEGVTHSICTLEFEDHRPLYDWYINTLIKLGASVDGVPQRPRQYEFARMNLTYTMMSKRKFLELVGDGSVRGWDDPRMPTLSGLRRKGFTAEALRAFATHIGVTKFNSRTDVALLENFVRDDLNNNAPRRMAVINPLKVVITNYPDDKDELLEAANHPKDESMGTREVPFSRELYIEQDDFMEDPPKKFFRLGPGREVRLRFAYFVTCTDVIKDEAGNVVEIHCTYDPETRGGDAPDGRKVKGTIHWVSAKHAIKAEARLYEQLFNVEKPDDLEEGQDWRDNLNPESEQIIAEACVEPSVKDASVGTTYQFERTGYFTIDPDSTDDKMVFNRVVTLKDSWAKQNKK